jgi:cellobiose dehydrogenase (acceptor)
LYWYPTDWDFSTERGWPSSWSWHTPYTDKLKQRLPSTDNPSPDGVRTLTETMPVMQSLLGKMGYSQITLNDNVNFKNAAYGWSAYNVSSA